MNYFLNLDFIYYLIYLFFRSIYNFFAGIFGFNTKLLDTDGDGIPDKIDSDADGDGKIDPGKHDLDGDGIIDGADADVNGDGIIDNGPDLDGNGIKDIFDQHSQNSDVNLVDLINYLTNSDYKISGNGFGAWSDGYSLFKPPHGWDSWGNGFFDSIQHWIENFFTNPYCPSCPSFFDLIFGGINSIFWLLSFLILILFLFLKDKEKKLKELDYEKYEQVFEKEELSGENKKSKRWEEILSLIDSPNKNDWRMAIMNADKLLDEVLIEQGYTGTTLGERLKSAGFDSLQNAWEAHKIRNLIAHDPHHDLTRQEAKRAIQNYSLVFNEFYYL